MNKSDEINELATALSKVQGEICNATKDRSGYGYQYVDLAAILDIARPLLSKHGLTLVQICSSADDKVNVETILTHTSGQWIGGVMSMPVLEHRTMSGPQRIGATVTYNRRYSAASILSIAQADNDASAVDYKLELAGLAIDDLRIHARLKTWMNNKDIKAWSDVTADQANVLLKAIKEGK